MPRPSASARSRSSSGRWRPGRTCRAPGDPRRPEGAAPLDRLVRGPPRDALPASQLRGRAPQRPLRHPVARGLLLRRPLRPSAARHRHRDLACLRARGLAGLRGHQARLGARELQLLHQRARVRAHPRFGRARRTRGLAPPAPVPLRPRDRPVAARRRASRSHRSPCSTCASPPRARAPGPSPARGRGPAGRLPGRGPRAPGRPAARRAPRRGSRTSRSASISATCAGS